MIEPSNDVIRAVVTLLCEDDGKWNFRFASAEHEASKTRIYIGSGARYLYFSVSGIEFGGRGGRWFASSWQRQMYTAATAAARRAAALLISASVTPPTDTGGQHG